MKISELVVLCEGAMNVAGEDAEVVMDVTDERHLVIPITNWVIEPGKLILS